MHRSFLIRTLALLASSTGLIVGCSETPTEGTLPPVRTATPEEMANLQKKIEAEKISKGATGYKPPPGVNMPRQ